MELRLLFFNSVVHFEPVILMLPNTVLSSCLILRHLWFLWRTVLLILFNTDPYVREKGFLLILFGQNSRVFSLLISKCYSISLLYLYDFKQYYHGILWWVNSPMTWELQPVMPTVRLKSKTDLGEEVVGVCVCIHHTQIFLTAPCSNLPMKSVLYLLSRICIYSLPSQKK